MFVRMANIKEADMKRIFHYSPCYTDLTWCGEKPVDNRVPLTFAGITCPKCKIIEQVRLALLSGIKEIDKSDDMENFVTASLMNMLEDLRDTEWHDEY